MVNSLRHRTHVLQVLDQERIEFEVHDRQMVADMRKSPPKHRRTTYERPRTRRVSYQYCLAAKHLCAQEANQQLQRVRGECCIRHVRHGDL